MSGYVRQTSAPSYNPGCPIPTNVNGYGEAEQFAEGDPFAGYQRPATVNASCGQFTASTRRKRFRAGNFQTALVRAPNQKPQT